ncbi:hypothetical protein [Campylobacter upsaliensis]|uniref:hypothetical protein n=1 Tax=Campylobacter upsaliensis TaxID=28080 RepID=UPI0018D46E7A|nr:hypothetical protein [Campylobacter upsaliensis]MCR2108049.1 hypothetical protein [Campylobacter upsaliensis]MCR2109860.1 hypothetical protein [Campylobacter upsaliensis]MCR2113817.1 hypothetical protein [Campylobacter upsaliensis]MCR2120854.1 hypothetical protein [Campylobacter upsaliensis]MCR2121981.1 hypothetical protein [Campylobacter upsaliensis]
MILRQSLQNRIVYWGVAVSTFILIASGMFQMPVSKRYMINELPLRLSYQSYNALGF